MQGRRVGRRTSIPQPTIVSPEPVPEPDIAFVMPEDFRVNTRGGELGLRAGGTVFLDHDGRYVPYGTVPPDSSHAITWPHDFQINTHGGEAFVPAGAEVHLNDQDAYEWHRDVAE